MTPRTLAFLAILIWACSGCAATPGRTTTEDPLMKVNRGVHKFNDTIDRAALKPVAKGYRRITPRWMRTGIGNFFANLSYPTTAVNQFLQGKFKLGARDTARFVLNSTVGVGGFLDVATRAGLDSNDEDFGQTLAVWGVPSGPYVVMPVFGPSSLRDAPSRLLNYFSSPLTYVNIPWETQWGLRAVDVVHMRSELLQVDATLERAFDRYAFMRDAWVQRREYEIFDGSPPEEALEDVEDFSEEDESANETSEETTAR